MADLNAAISTGFSVLGAVVQNVVVTAVWQPVGDSCGKLLKVRTNRVLGRNRCYLYQVASACSMGFNRMGRNIWMMHIALF